MALKQSISGIRGIWGAELTADVVIRFINALPVVLPESGTIILGRDTRQSGDEISKAIVGTLLAFGYDVCDVGINPTPTIEIATAQNAIAGIIITASHNPTEYNGLKFLDNRGMFISAVQMQAIIDAFNEGYRHTKGKTAGRVYSDFNAPKLHIDRILSQDIIDTEAIREKEFSVLYDANGGAGATVIPTLLKRLGCKVFPINCELDGIFRHPPVPTPDNLAEIGKMVMDKNCDIGFATDPDADRLALIDETGIVLSEEMTLCISADFVLSKIKTDLVVNLSTSSLIEYIAQKHGVSVYRTPVGEINVSSKMLELGAKFGGEGNGGAIMPSLHPGRDAAIAVAIVLAKMAESGKSLSQISSEFPERYIVKDAISLEGGYSLDEDKLIAMTQPTAIDRQDGLWLSFPDGFLHIRPSNTEPIIRIIAERDTSEQAKILVNISKGLLQIP